MSYEIKRLEEEKSRLGEDEVFLAIEITDKIGTYPYATWLSTDEVALFKNDKSSIDSIVEKYLPKAKTAYEQSLILEEQVQEQI